MTTTDDTRAGLAALTARGHEPRRKLGPEHRTRTLYYDAGMGRIAWRRDGDDMWFHCDDDDAANAVRCALLDRVTEKANALIDRTGGVKLFRRDEPHYLLDDLHPSLLAAYEALYPLEAAVGKAATHDSAACTDDQCPICAGRILEGGGMATATVTEQYEAMVARGHETGAMCWASKAEPPHDKPPNVQTAILSAEQDAAIADAGIPQSWTPASRCPFGIFVDGPLSPKPAQPNPAAELAESDLVADIGEVLDAWERNEYSDVATIGGISKILQRYAAKGGEK